MTMKTPERVTEPVAELSEETKAIARAHGATLAEPEPSVAQLLQFAIQHNQDPDALGKLMDLYERMEANKARKAFAKALLCFQNEVPIIAKNREVNTGKYRYDYATFDYLASTIRPHMDRWGLSHTADTEVTERQVVVTTIIRHTDGHAERTTFTASIDNAAAMNAPQKVASAVSYARRYGLMLALGIATGVDDDARAAGTEYLTDEQAAKIVELLEWSGADRARFLAWIGADQVAHIPAHDFQKAVRALKEKGAA